jgi:AcrR family transcriptional regulator
MYVVKDHDERKNEFLDVAMRLFMQTGYEQTSVNAIIDAVGVSKGAFYHYFRTKEDLLDEIASRSAKQALSIVEPLIDDASLTAVEKLNEMFRRTNSFKAANREIIVAIAKVFYDESNVMLRARLQNRSIDAVAPLLARIIELGNEEGSMRVSHPQETARFVLRIGGDVVAEFAGELPKLDDHPEALERVLLQMEVYTQSVERILGMIPGELVLVDESLMQILRGV